MPSFRVGSTAPTCLAQILPNIWAEPEKGDRGQAWRSAELMRRHRHRCALSIWERTDAPAPTKRLLSPKARGSAPFQKGPALATGPALRV